MRIKEREKKAGPHPTQMARFTGGGGQIDEGKSKKNIISIGGGGKGLKLIIIVNGAKKGGMGNPIHFWRKKMGGEV